MRPKSYSQFFDLDLDTSASANYTKTGDLITLPFSELSYVNQDKASRQLQMVHGQETQHKVVNGLLV